MKIEIEVHIKAILFGVDETIVENLKLGNEYEIIKDSMTNHRLWEEFDYTAFGIRRVYEEAKLNKKLDVAILNKKINTTYDANFKKDIGHLIEDKQIIEVISEIENIEMNYIDKKMRIIRLYKENAFNIKELLINTYMIDENANKHLCSNSKIPFPDRIFGEVEKLHLNSPDEIKDINTFISNFNLNFPNSNFESNILSSACFLYDQSYHAPVITLRFMVCVIGIESLLVDGNSELSYKLSRNCAMLLSNNASEYLTLFKKIRDIYNKRSKFVHNGIVENIEDTDVIYVRTILRKIIFKIVDKNISQANLIKELDLKGYF